MAWFLYEDKFLIDFFVASWIILPYCATVAYKASSEDKTQAKQSFCCSVILLDDIWMSDKTV